MGEGWREILRFAQNDNGGDIEHISFDRLRMSGDEGLRVTYF